jgi:hypothetical protein
VASKRKPVVEAIKEKVAAFKGQKVSEAVPDVAPPVAPVAPQGGKRRCVVCGNEATGPVCPVDGAEG